MKKLVLNATSRMAVVTAIFCWLVLSQQVVLGQAEKLGIVQYRPVQGWTKTAKENVVAFSTVSPTGGFCIITLYGATPGTGNPQNDFSREWKNLVVDQFGVVVNPKTETQIEDGWTVIAAGTPVEFQDTKALALVTVMSGFGKTVSVLAVFNEESYVRVYTTFVSGLNIEKTVPMAPPLSAAPPTVNGKLVIPMPTRQLTISDIVGEWGETAGFTTRYVDRYSGTYAGFDSLHYRSKMTFTANGGYANDFFAVRNGRKISEETVGTVTIVGLVLSIKHKSTAKYVIRGWLELPEMTVLTVCGPWYDDDVIPQEIFSNPDQGSNLDKNWIRKR